jgi:hypothetical protein
MNIIEMAKQAGFGIDEAPIDQPYVIQPLHGKIDDELTRFAALVGNQKLEEAAVYFENHWSYEWTDDQVVAAIRALKGETE